MVVNDEENMWMVTFYADWCPYCEPFSPELESAQNDLQLTDKKIKFGAVNVMENRDLTIHYGVARSPSVKIFGKDKVTPEDYEGHRKQAELVTYLVEYADTNEFVVPPPPLPPTATYLYNINSIVGDVSAAHGKRINDAEVAHSEAIGEITKLGHETLDLVKTDFEARLTELVTERNLALTDSKQSTTDEIIEARTIHANNIAFLDKEAIETI